MEHKKVNIQPYSETEFKSIVDGASVEAKLVRVQFVGHLLLLLTLFIRFSEII